MVVPQLPNEILESVFTKLIPQHVEKDSVRTLYNAGLACSRFLTVSQSSRIWKSHYFERWYRCDETRENLRKDSVKGDWYKMYIIRSRIDHRADSLLDGIVCQTTGREVLASELVQDMGYDIWDIMSRITEQVQLTTFEILLDRSGNVQSDTLLPVAGLTRKYWARQILDMIARVRGLNIWRPLGESFVREDVSFEHGLAGFSAFFGQDVERIFEEFDRLAEECRAYLSVSQAQSLPDKLIQICSWMRQKGFMKTDLINYHNLMNHFPHGVLFEDHVTLPMSLVYVFVCITRRLGLNAHPVAFPQKVLAIVIPSEGESIYIDVFESVTRPLLLYPNLVSMLWDMGIDPASAMAKKYSTPASTATILLRVVANIFRSLEGFTLWSENRKARRLAHYAACSAALLLTGDFPLVQALFDTRPGGPLDCEVVIKQTLRPALPEATRQELDLYLMRQADIEKYPLPTPSAEGQQKAYCAGMMFIQKDDSYVSVIVGWNAKCEASEHWMIEMRVDELERGRKQPFYRCLSQDGHGVRYVAEEHIHPLIRPTANDIYMLIAMNEDIGRWFDGIDVLPSGAARFKLSNETRTHYPDDEAVGRAFLADHS